MLIDSFMIFAVLGALLLFGVMDFWLADRDDD